MGPQDSSIKLLVGDYQMWVILQDNQAVENMKK